jgi:hypothetical protein
MNYHTVAQTETLSQALYQKIDYESFISKLGVTHFISEIQYGAGNITFKFFFSGKANLSKFNISYGRITKHHLNSSTIT